MTAAESAGARRRRGPDLLRIRFAERLRELLPGGELTLSQSVLGRDAVLAKGQSAGRLTWTQAERSIEFEAWIALTPSLATLQALPAPDLRRQPIPVLIAPHLTVRACLRLERAGWSYYSATGSLLIQHHDPLIAIRVTSARPTVGSPPPARARE